MSMKQLEPLFVSTLRLYGSKILFSREMIWELNTDRKVEELEIIYWMGVRNDEKWEDREMGGKCRR
jgi:hypothetical protein